MLRARKMSIALVGGMVALLFLWTNLSLAAPKSVTLKLWSAWPAKMDPSKPGLEMLRDMLEKRGKEVNLSLNYVGGPEVFGPTQGIESLQQGTIDMAYTAGAYNTGVVPEVDALKLLKTLPWEDRERGIYELMNSWHQEKGLEYLARASSGQSFQGYLNVKREKPDLSGLTMRIVPIYKPLTGPLNAKAVMTAGGEVYTALERGTVDGFWWGGREIRPWGWHEVCQYIWGPPFWTVDVYVMMNKDKWDSLHQSQREFLTELFRDYEIKTYAAQVKAQEEITRDLLHSGMEMIRFSPEDREWYLNMAYEQGWEAAIEKSSEVEKLKEIVSE